MPVSGTRRLLRIAGGFAVALAAPIIAAFVAASPGAPAQVAQCPGGEHNDPYTLNCVPFLTPNTAATGNSACPPGVSGAECGVSSGNEAQPPGPPAPSPEEQELQDIVTPGY
ncbi:hypothetical protein K3G64_13890 [Mycobacterium sp. IDR2000157661]|nr:hypothetical protein K3G64_13890 [Mycobacterium sp. IDR2000157661]